MPGKLNVYNLGEMGVQLVKSPLHSVDGELILAQNAVFDKNQDAGGIKKRPGMLPLNASVLAGQVRGIYNVQFDEPSSTYTGVFGYYVGVLNSGGVHPVMAWYRSADGITWTLTAFTFPDITDEFAYGAAGSPVDGDGRFYYINGGNTGSNTPYGVRTFDGVTDSEVMSFAGNIGLVGFAQPYCSCGYDGAMYFGGSVSYDMNPGITSGGGAVFKLVLATGQVQQLGETHSEQAVGPFPSTTLQQAGGYPTAVGVAFGRLYAGVVNNVDGSVRVFSVPITGGTWTLEHTFAADYTRVTGILEYAGDLYFTMQVAFGGATNPSVYKMTSGGTWSVSDSQVLGGAVPNQYGTPVVFNSELYVSYARDGVALIRKFDGSSWTTDRNVYTSDAGSTDVGFVQGREIDGVLFFAVIGSTTGKPLLLRRTSAAAWSVPLTRPAACDDVTLAALRG